MSNSVTTCIDDFSVAAIEQNGFSVCVYNEIKKWSIHMEIFKFFDASTCYPQTYSWKTSAKLVI